jgi:putative transposase
MITKLSASYPARLVCALLSCPRSTYYYEPVVDPEDALLIVAIEPILMRWPFYGYRRATA